MKKLKTISFFFLFILILVVSGAIYADSTIYGSCGAKPGVLNKLFTNADKIREKCIEDIYEENKLKTQKELEELARTGDLLSAELKKVAIKSGVGLVQCSPRPGEPARDKKLIKRCEEIVSSKNAVIDRMRELTGWNDLGRPSLQAKNVEEAISPPCPANDKLSDLRIAATFNRKLFKTWEYCRALMIDKM